MLLDGRCNTAVACIWAEVVHNIGEFLDLPSLARLSLASTRLRKILERLIFRNMLFCGKEFRVAESLGAYLRGIDDEHMKELRSHARQATPQPRFRSYNLASSDALQY